MLRRNFMQLLVAGGATMAAREGWGANHARVRELRLGHVRATLAEPRNQNGAGVLIQPTIAAINPFVIEIAMELAGLGYTAVAWDPYNGETAPAETMGQFARAKLLVDQEAVSDLKAITDHMVGPLGLRKIGTLGWCLGGRFVLLHAAKDHRISAVASYNPTIYSPTPVLLRGLPLSKADFPGQTMDEIALAEEIACPVQICRPGEDLAQPAEYARLQASLYARRSATSFDYFPDAHHGFHYERANPANRQAADLAWPITLAMMNRTLVST